MNNRTTISQRTKSPQSWKKRSSYGRRRSVRTSRTNYTGGKKPYSKFPKFKFNWKLNKETGRMVLIGLVALVGIGGLFSVGLVAWVARDLPNPNRIIQREVAQSTKIYDRTGEQLLFDIHGEEKRTLIPLNEIPQHLVDATLTAEDRKFYEHKGISITGILRSVFKNITTGSRVGGSTLTQQLVKNAILTTEKTYTRKIREVILAWQIEKNFSKDEILQLYFNEIPYGSVAYGAEAAAQTYFAKSVRDLSLAESAVLAALPQAPTYYSPYGSHTDALFTRQHWILDSMAELGYITKEDAEFAKGEEIVFNQRREDITAPHFVMYVREYLTEKYGELTVEQGGLQVITTLDLYKQEIAEEVITEYAENNAEQWQAHNAALLSMDPKTGQILAMVGSKDFFDDEIDGQVNVTTRLRQPGSSFKPMVYAAGFKKGYTPETVLMDVETNFLNYDGNDYKPKNYTLEEHGPVTIRKALQGSLNIPAVKMIYLTGVDDVIDLAEDLGYTSFRDRSRFGLSLVLGGGEVTMLEHVGAYSTLAREGEWHPAVSILEIKDKDGNVLESYEKQERKVLDTEIARKVNNILSDNAARAYAFGENNYLTLGGRPVAAKTGTTNDYHDAWTIGYTPSLATGVWVGNSNNDAMRRGAAGGVVAAPIWNAYMSRVLGDTPTEAFREPEPNELDIPVLNGSIADGVKVKIDKASGKLATNLTPESMVEEVTFQNAHSILYYIDKDDPQGGSPPNRSGQQYERWEAAIADWAERNEITIEQPPTEVDDVHTSANRPTIRINSPSSNERINSRSFSATVSAAAPRGVSRVEYYIGNSLIGTSRQSPFNIQVNIQDPNIQSGYAVLKAIAYDDVDNSDVTTRDIQLDLPPLPSALNWTAPALNSTLSSSDFPLTINADLTNASNISRIDLHAVSQSGGEIYINTIRQFPGGRLLGQWLQKPDGGDYTIVATITNKDGFIYDSDALSITVN